MKFQAIVDTSAHRVLGHECFSEPFDERNWSAFAPTASGIYFLSVPAPWMAACLRELASGRFAEPQRLVFQVGDHDPGLVEFPRRCGAGVALNCTGTTPGFLEVICESRPDYIKLDPGLTRNAEQPASAATIRKLVELSDRFGMRVIATGVDRPRVVENLWLLGVEIMQGELFGMPVPYAGRMGSDLASLAQALEPEDVFAPHTRLPV